MPSNQSRGERRPLPGEGHMEDYTVPFLVAAGVLCFLALVVLWAIVGLPVVILGTMLLERVTRRA